MEDVIAFNQIFRFLLIAFIISLVVIRTKTGRKQASSAPPSPQKREKVRTSPNQPRKPKPQASTAYPKPATKAAPHRPKVVATPALRETEESLLMDTGDIEEVRKGIIWSIILQRRF